MFIYNAKMKCGLVEKKKGVFDDPIDIDAFVWYDDSWKHDDYNHSHDRYQLTYVLEGYQYFHIDNKIYLVPQNHCIWIPSGKKHRVESEAQSVNLRAVFFKKVFDHDFYNDVHLFSAPAVLKEMILYASKWNNLVEFDEEQAFFMQSLLRSLPNFCVEKKNLQIPIPADSRLLPVCNYINHHYQSQFKLDDIAEVSLMSVRNLQRIFKQETGITLQKYAQMIRILKSVELLNERQYTLTQIAQMVGYRSLSAFTNSYNAIMKENVGTAKLKNVSSIETKF